MKEFIDINRSMNNGLNNNSTLANTTLMIFKLCQEKYPEKLSDLTLFMLPEEAFSNPHPGLNQVNNFCNEQIKNMEIATMRK